MCVVCREPRVSNKTKYCVAHKRCADSIYREASRDKTSPSWKAYQEIFKDEVRVLGVELGLPPPFVGRHPFPGPGLAIRIPGEITPEKVAVLQKADAIYLEEIRRAGLYDSIWQAFAVLLPVKTVGVMGDARTYEDVLALRAVTSTDGMTADIYPFESAFLSRVSTRIINEVKGINRVVYDYTSKPPGTIEWE